MVKQQGSMQIEGAEGGDAVELTLTGNQVGLSLLIGALKAKLKAFGYTESDLSTRCMQLTLHIEPQSDDSEPVENFAVTLPGVPEKIRGARRPR